MEIYSIREPDLDKLVEIMAKMEELGGPVIKVVGIGSRYLALEGSHRLPAAHAFGFKPVPIILAREELIDVSEYDWFNEEDWPEKILPAGLVAERLFDTQKAVLYRF